MHYAANDPIVEHLEAGQDVRVEGRMASARLDMAAGWLEGPFNVIRLTAPRGGLSLSALIAQLSGRESFDDQDDAALEVGFRRLCGFDSPDRPTVLLLDATHGVQRAVLRYLQQVSHNAPRLLFAVAAFPELTALLEAPDMARLRGRLETVVEADAMPEAMPGQATSVYASPVNTSLGRALMVLPPSGALAVQVSGLPALQVGGLPALPGDWTIDSRRGGSTRPRRSRRAALIWASSALAVVASTAFGAWLGQARMATPGGMVAEAKGRATPAVLAEPAQPTQLAEAPELVRGGAPPLAAKVAPTPARGAPTVAAVAAAPVAPAPVPVPVLVKLTPPDAVVVAAGAPLAAVPPTPEMVSFASVEERLAAPTGHPLVRDTRRGIHWRVARSRSWTRAPRFDEDGRPLPNYEVEDLPAEEAAPAPAPGPRRVRGRVVREPVNGQYDSSSRGAAPDGDSDPSGGRNQAPGDGAYIGTYITGPYGARVFRSGP